MIALKLKFTMGGHSGSGAGGHGSGSSATGSSHLPNINLKPIESVSLPIQRPQLPPQTPAKPPQTQPFEQHMHTTVKYRSVPAYLTSNAATATPLLDGTRTVASDQLDASLLRSVEIGVDKLDLINLSTAAIVGPEETSAPIFIDAPLVDEFFPGDQLISIEDYSMLGKSVDDVKSTVNRLVDHQQDRPSKVRFKVRTNLAASELFVNNLATVASVNSPTKASMDKPNTPTSVTPIDDFDSTSVWLIHPNGAYSAAKTFAKIIHKSINDSPNLIKYAFKQIRLFRKQIFMRRIIKYILEYLRSFLRNENDFKAELKKY